MTTTKEKLLLFGKIILGFSILPLAGLIFTICTYEKGEESILLALSLFTGFIMFLAYVFGWLSEKIEEKESINKKDMI